MPKNLKILIIDDDAVDRLAIKRLLAISGVEAETAEAANGIAGLEMMAQDVFDIVFLDYYMPTEDGLAVLQSIRQLYATIPVIMLTGQDDTELAVRLVQSGATDYVAKEKLYPDRLFQAIQYALRAAQAEAMMRQAEAKIRRQNEYLAALRETAVALMSRHELEDLLQFIMQRAAELFATPHGYIALVNAEETHLEIKCGSWILRRENKCGAGFWPRIGGKGMGNKTAINCR